MRDKSEQQKQPFTEQDGLFDAELVIPAAPVVDDEPPFDPYYDVPPAEDDYHAPAMDAPMMEAHAQDVPVAPAAFTAADPR